MTKEPTANEFEEKNLFFDSLINELDVYSFVKKAIIVFKNELMSLCRKEEQEKMKIINNFLQNLVFEINGLSGNFTNINKVISALFKKLEAGKMKESTIEELQRASKEIQRAMFIINVTRREDKKLDNMERVGTMMINLAHESDTLLDIISKENLKSQNQIKEVGKDE